MNSPANFQNCPRTEAHHTRSSIQDMFVNIILLLFFTSLSESTITFLSPSDISGIELHSAHFLFIGSQTRFNVTNVTAVAADPFHACHKSEISKNEFIDKF